MDDFDKNFRSIARTGIVITLIWAAVILGGIYMIVSVLT